MSSICFAHYLTIESSLLALAERIANRVEVAENQCFRGNASRDALDAAREAKSRILGLHEVVLEASDISLDREDLRLRFESKVDGAFAALALEAEVSSH